MNLYFKNLNVTKTYNYGSEAREVKSELTWSRVTSHQLRLNWKRERSAVVRRWDSQMGVGHIVAIF